MASTSPEVSKILNSSKPRDLSLLKDPKILSSTLLASQLEVKRETLYLESLYDNALSPLPYSSSISVAGDVSSTLEVGLHIISSALGKNLWVSFLDPNRDASSLALHEAVTGSPRFVCVRNFAKNKFTSVLSNLVSGMQVIVACVPVKVSSAQMARVMARVREHNAIVISLDPYGLCEASFDRRIVARTLSFQGLKNGAGVLTDKSMEIDEFEHGVKLNKNSKISNQIFRRYA